jgi:hypothetical protein
VIERRRVPVSLVFLALIFLASCRSDRGTIVLFNKTNESISRATVSLSWGEKVEVTGIGSSKSVTIPYTVREGYYRIEVVFQSGKRLESKPVYITSGFDFEDRATVTSSEIQLTHSPITPQ